MKSESYRSRLIARILSETDHLSKMDLQDELYDLDFQDKVEEHWDNQPDFEVVDNDMEEDSPEYQDAFECWYFESQRKVQEAQEY